jgi:hypothetical protein
MYRTVEELKEQISAILNSSFRPRRQLEQISLLLEEEVAIGITVTEVDKNGASGTNVGEGTVYVNVKQGDTEVRNVNENTANGTWAVSWSDLSEGDYLVSSVLVSEGACASANQVFTVEAPPTTPPPTGPFSKSNPPPASWNLYGANSVFNTPLSKHFPNGIPIAPNSATKVGNTFNGSPQLLPTVNERWSIPIYFSRSSDPLYRLNITNFRSKDYVQDLPDAIRLPSDATASLSVSGDQNIWVVDQTDGFVYHFRLGPEGGINHSTKVITGWRCFRLQAEGTGFRFPDEPVPRAAPIRPEELSVPGGDIGHIISFNCSCVGEGAVGWYSTSDSVGRNICNKPDSALVHFGDFMYLDRTDAQIAAVNAPEWKKNMWRGLAHYGCIVERNSGSPQPDGTDWYFQFENRLDRATNPYTGSIALTLDYSSGMDWHQHMRVIDPTKLPPKS